MPVVVGMVITAAATVDSTYQAKKGADAAARTSTQVAQYNAKVDRAEAAQIDLDSQQNIRAMRQDAATYMSRQASSYAASGVRIDSGSPLAVQAVTAGRFEQRAQQAWQDSNAKQQRLESAAQSGIAMGNAKADMYHKEGVAAVMSGAARLSSIAVQGYKDGAFDGFKGTGSNDLSGGLASGSTDLPTADVRGYA